MRSDLTGRRFRKLVVVSFAYRRGDSYWNCVCDCGNTTVVAGGHLLRPTGGTMSCGCANRKHGKSRPGRVAPLYKLWLSMRARCNNPNHADYKHYGGRGITVCAEWGDFSRFEADMSPRPVGMRLERIDNDKGYSKDNCKWATQLEQMANTRVVRRITFQGATRHLSEWSRVLRVPLASLYRLLADHGDDEGMRRAVARKGAAR